MLGSGTSLPDVLVYPLGFQVLSMFWLPGLLWILALALVIVAILAASLIGAEPAATSVFTGGEPLPAEALVPAAYWPDLVKLARTPYVLPGPAAWRADLGAEHVPTEEAEAEEALALAGATGLLMDEEEVEAIELPSQEPAEAEGEAGELPSEEPAEVETPAAPAAEPAAQEAEAPATAVPEASEARAPESAEPETVPPETAEPAATAEEDAATPETTPSEPAAPTEVTRGAGGTVKPRPTRPPTPSPRRGGKGGKRGR
jgi:hypothetical protein